MAAFKTPTNSEEAPSGATSPVNDHVMDVLALFQSRHPDCATEIVEIPFSDPFGPVRRNEVDTAVVLLPMEEDDLVLGHIFSEQPQALALSTGHPYAKRDGLTAEDLAECPLASAPATRRRSTGAARRVPAPHQAAW